MWLVATILDNATLGIQLSQPKNTYIYTYASSHFPEAYAYITGGKSQKGFQSQSHAMLEN